MGLKGELVKSVFLRSRSGSHHGRNGKRSALEKRRWSSVRSYLCGDELEFDSVIAEEDSASVKSSEVTVTQPVTGDLNAEDSSQVVGLAKDDPQEQQNTKFTSKLFDEEAAAVIIQAAFRRHLARKVDEAKKATSEDEDDELPEGIGSPRMAESIGTSIEVQTGNSVDILSVRDERLSVISSRMHKARTTQFLKPKEDWDDSTVSSNISKMRLQHRLEAMTRRERALAYAFSQQLSICSKKRQMKIPEGSEPDVGWSWLERWMATRESSIAAGPGNQRFIVGKRLLDLAVEEKESCGSNEVPVHPHAFPMSTAEDRDKSKPSIDGCRNTRNTSRHKASPKGRHHKGNAQVCKKDATKDLNQALRQKPAGEFGVKE